MRKFMKLNNKIDHTLLKANATQKEIRKYCDEAKEYGFASVVVNSANIPFIKQELKDTKINAAAVVGFPLGAMLTNVKAFEASEAVRFGANEIDMVINIGWLKDKDYDAVEADIKAVVEASKPAIVKVIIETSYLTDYEKMKVCHLAVSAGAEYIKTSTGFTRNGATVEDVILMKTAVNGEALIKASGGIRTNYEAKKLIEAGADRLGVGDGKKVLA